jgi:hypothetical protein
MDADTPTDTPTRSKRISLAPLSFEEAVKGLLATGPHPKDDGANGRAPTESTDPKRRRKRKASRNGATTADRKN